MSAPFLPFQHCLGFIGAEEIPADESDLFACSVTTISSVFPVRRLSIKLWGSRVQAAREQSLASRSARSLSGSAAASEEGTQTTAGRHHIRGFRFPRGLWCHVCIGNEHLSRSRQHPLCWREAALACALACDPCDYTLAADSGPLLMPFPETPDSGPVAEQRLIIVLRRRRRTINHTDVFLLSLTGTFDPL